MKRRHFLIAGTTGGAALLIGCGSDPHEHKRIFDAKGPWASGSSPEDIALNAWIRVGKDGAVTVAMSKSEMGQGVHTALLMIVAEELDCGWDHIGMAASPIHALYGNVMGVAEGVPFRPDDEGPVARGGRWVMHQVARTLGIMMTGGSSSVRDLWLPLRNAAAMARATLVAQVAKTWQTEAAAVRLDKGVFSHADGRRMALGEVVNAMTQTTPPTWTPAATWTLKSPEQFTIVGRRVGRLDSPSKVDGRALYGIDIVRPGMLYAAINMGTVRGASVKAVDDSKAKGMPGVRHIVTIAPLHGATGGVAVVADRWWRAKQAAAALTVQWDAGAMANVSTTDVEARLAQAAQAESGFGFWKAGDVDAALGAAAKRIEAQYVAPYLPHAPLEPLNCTIEFDGAKAVVWVPTQVPGLVQNAVAKVLAIDASHVTVHIPYLGGGFGRRLEVDVAAQAAAIALQVKGTPIQLLWTREDDIRHDFYRPAAVSRFAAGLDAQGRLQAWSNTSAGQGISAQYMPRNVGMPMMGPDKTSSEGAFDVAYEFPNVRVGHVNVDLPVPIGFWRAVGHSHQGFFKESFLDECAHAAGADPYAYRRDLLKSHPRQRAVLELAATKAGWGQPLTPGPDGSQRARGIALHESFGATVAQVAEVSVGAQGEIRVHRVVCAIDCGLAVNPDGVAQQMESAIVFGLSAALAGGVTFDKGQVAQSNFHDQAPLRLHESPAIEVYIVPSAEHPGGVGEPGLPPIAPAVANAVFVLKGQRLRRLPLKLAA